MRGRYRRDRSPPVARPSTRTGSRSGSPAYVIRAPIACRGYTTRSMGRAPREASPLNSASIPRPASNPVRSRAVVPLLPQSRGWLALFQDTGPGTRSVPSPTSSKVAPSARKHDIVLATSRDDGTPARIDSPSARVERRTNRCAIDLSPGTAASLTRPPPTPTRRQTPLPGSTRPRPPPQDALPRLLEGADVPVPSAWR